ncbi:MAG: NUDIX domain-containing protein [Anaerolineae bacterium]
MRYGISAAALVVREGQLLLVNHAEAGRYDFWLPPGGRLQGAESIPDCARRETLEETGLRIEPGHILYVQEFSEPGYHFVKFFLTCASFEGELTLDNREPGEEFLVDARFFSREGVQGMEVYPAILKGQFWADLEAGDNFTRYLGLEEIRS